MDSHGVTQGGELFGIRCMHGGQRCRELFPLEFTSLPSHRCLQELGVLTSGSLVSGCQGASLAMTGESVPTVRCWRNEIVQGACQQNEDG